MSATRRARVFLLSPASCGGERARQLFDDRARFPLARALRAEPGVAIGEVFSFISALYFRGKLEYARTYARPPAGLPGVFVITAAEGLQVPEARIRIDALARWATVPIDVAEARYAEPLRRDAGALAAALREPADVVLLGSVATGKYVDVLQRAFDARLQFPRDFVGRGDMSRGGLLLRSARAGRELDYVPVDGAIRRGVRPPRLEPPSR